MSTTVKCIVNLASQFFIVYSGAFFVKKYNDQNLEGKSDDAEGKC